MEMKCRSLQEWRRVNVFAGAPICPRIVALLARLRTIGFQVFGQADEAESDRVVMECFPNEIAWSVGSLGYAPLSFNIDTLQLYKRLGKRRTPLPKDIFDATYRYLVHAAFAAAGLPERICESWLRRLGEWFVEDGVLDEDTGVATAGKKFDDAVDSVLSLSAAVAAANGKAHIHEGDPQDGHIIGPGLPGVR